MKANELMLGDWVSCGGHYRKIQSLEFDNTEEEKCWFWSDEDQALCLLSEHEPISLTSEILEKNGIVFDYTIELRDDYGNPYEIKGYALHGTTKWGDDYLLQYDEDKDLHISTEIYGEITLHNINFIHELQHALRLCGIEKEIEL